MPIRWTVKPQVEEESERELAGFFKALSHPVRVHLFRVLLKKGPSSCGDLVASVPLAQSTVSQHLGKLKASGLVEDEIQGNRRIYRVHPTAVDRLQSYTSNL
jgi:DNA-binding transcriptional ArsR family regulator